MGGSLTGILELLPYLDRRRYEPALVLAEPKPGLELPDTRIHVLAPRADAGPVSARSSVTRDAPPRRPGASRSCCPGRASSGRLFTQERPALVYLASGLNSNLATVVAAARTGVPGRLPLQGLPPHRARRPLPVALDRRRDHA